MADAGAVARGRAGVAIAHPGWKNPAMATKETKDEGLTAEEKAAIKQMTA